LLDNAPLWLDWQLEKAIAGQDLTQAEQYQAATQKIIRLLQNITDVTTRIHYLQKSAGLLSAGDARMIPLLFENLQTAIKGLKPLPEARSAASNLSASKFNQPSQSQYSAPAEFNDPIEDESDPAQVEVVPISIHPSQRLIEQAESLLLRIYLHYPIHRLTIIDKIGSVDKIDSIDEIDSTDKINNMILSFKLDHHIYLWDEIIRLSSQNNNQEEVNYLDERLIDRLQNSIANSPGKSIQTRHLFNLDEHTTEEIQRSTLVIDKTITRLKKFKLEEARNHWLSKFKNDNSDSERRVGYYQLVQAIDHKIKQLEKDQSVTIDDLVSL
jgi:DNA primase